MRFRYRTFDGSVGVLHEPYIEPDIDAKSDVYGENKNALAVTRLQWQRNDTKKFYIIY